ncbi:hypothetical protein ACNQR7_31675 [Mycolicibacterium senegalense]|uniref:hypothetical protein n=1 Tax=Mycolicibacterium senegalense TaxID=1796 RepID=UPI003AAC575A
MSGLEFVRAGLGHTIEALVRRMFEANFRSIHRIGRAMLESVLATSVIVLDRKHEYFSNGPAPCR